MLTTILVLVLAVIAIAIFSIVGVVWYVKSRSRKKSMLPKMGDDPTASSKIDTCTSCGEKRIIVNPDDTLCASCYSSLRTKKLG
jgi:hypothetical protein